MKKIVVLGTSGQVASQLKIISNSDKNNWMFLDRNQLDLSQPEKIKDTLNNYQFDYLINTAAYTKVDLAEDEAKLCHTVNADAVKVLADLCFQKKSKFISFSTDYVFDGTKSTPYVESDKTNPLSQYGKSKLLSEKYILESGCQFVVIRTSWVYSAFGANFVKTIIKNAPLRNLKVVFDQIGSPTYAADLAFVVMHIIKNDLVLNKIYHYSNEGVASWYDFSKMIAKIYYPKAIIEPVLSSEFPQKAIRPKYSVLNKQLIKTDLQITIPHWVESLESMSKENH